MQQEESLICPICQLEFDFTVRIPKGLNCGHTVCLICAERLFKPHGKKCCLEVQPSQYKDLNNNQAIIQLMLVKQQNQSHNTMLQKEFSTTSRKIQDISLDLNLMQTNLLSQNTEYIQTLEKRLEQLEKVMNTNSRETEEQDIKQIKQNCKIYEQRIEKVEILCNSIVSPQKVQTENEKEQSNEQANKYKSEYTTLEKQFQQIQLENIKVKQLLADKQKIIESLQLQVNKIEKSQSLKGNLELNLKSLEQEKTEIEKNLKQQINNLSVKLHKKKMKVQMLKEKMQNIEKQHSQLNIQSSKGQDKEKFYLEQIGNLNQVLSDKQNYIKFLEKQNKEFQTKISLLKSQTLKIAQDQQDYMSTRAQTERTRESREDQEKLNSYSSSTVSELHKIIQDLSQRLKLQNQKNEELVLQNQNLEEDNNKLIIKLKELESQTPHKRQMTKRNQMQSLTQQEKVLQTQINDKECTCHIYRKEFIELFQFVENLVLQTNNFSNRRQKFQGIQIQMYEKDFETPRIQHNMHSPQHSVESYLSTSPQSFSHATSPRVIYQNNSNKQISQNLSFDFYNIKKMILQLSKPDNF